MDPMTWARSANAITSRIGNRATAIAPNGARWATTRRERLALLPAEARLARMDPQVDTPRSPIASPAPRLAPTPCRALGGESHVRDRTGVSPREQHPFPVTDDARAAA